MENYGIRVRARISATILAFVGGYGLLVALARVGDESISSPLPESSAWYLVIIVLPGASFIFWLLAARERIQAAGTRLTWSTFWTVAIWLIPYVNLIGSLYLMAEIDRAARRMRIPVNDDEWFRVWAMLWTALQLFSWFDGWLDEDMSMDAEQIAGWLQFFTAAAAIKLIWHITDAIEGEPARPRPGP